MPGRRQAGEPELHAEGRRQQRREAVAIKGKVIAARLLGDVVRALQGRDPAGSSSSRTSTARPGLQIVGISVDDTPTSSSRTSREMKMNYPVLQGLDHDDVQDAYGPMFGIPVTW